MTPATLSVSEGSHSVAAFPNSVCHFWPRSFPPVPCVREPRQMDPGGPWPRAWPPGENNEPFSCKDVWIVPWRWEKHKLVKTCCKKNDTPLFWVELIFGGIRFQICSKWLHVQRSFFQCVFRNVGKVNKTLTNIFSNRLPSLPSKQWLTLIYSYLWWVGHNWSFTFHAVGRWDIYIYICIYIYIMQLLWGSSMATRSPTNRKAPLQGMNFTTMNLL